MKKSFLTLLLTLLCATLSAREMRSLDGEWKFSTDENQSGTILVPGIWNNQGYGQENAKTRWGYIGVGHYSRTVEVPSAWAGQSVVLVLEGISRYAQVYVNGSPVGNELLGLIGPHEVELTPWVEAGKTLELRVDVDSRRRWEIDGMLGAAQLNDYMDIVWGGLWGHVRLEARPKTYLRNLYIRSNIQNSTCTAEVEICGESTTSNDLKLEIFTADGKTCVASKVESGKTAVTVEVPEAKLWSPDEPNLYFARLTLLDGDVPRDSLETRFGMREIRVDGCKILLNGKRLMLCGYGDDHIYPREFSMSTNKEMYLSRLRLIKSFGFNHVRHHSTIMPREYYEACDEVGIMPNAEFVIGYPHEVPGIGARWKQNVPAGTSPGPAIDLYMNRFEAVIREYRNHPCIFAWVFGNELSMSEPTPEWVALFERSCKIARTLDPDRLFLDFDGDWLKKLANDRRETTDMYSALFDEWSSPITNTAKFAMESPRKPVISHESGNYITFSRTDQMGMFDGLAYKPFWMEDGVARLQALGLQNEVEAWAVASENLYFLLHKSNLELLRKNEYISGYHWWLIQDYWTTSNGLVDFFFRPKSIAPERVRQVNGPAVVLMDGLRRIYTSGENIQLATQVSNFTGHTLTGTTTATFTPVRDSETPQPLKTVSENNLVTIEEGRLLPTAEFSTTAPEVQVPTQFLVTAEFASYGNPPIRNEWTTWVYPKTIAPSVENGCTIFVQPGLENLFEGWETSELPATGELPENAICVVSWLDERATDFLSRGGHVVLLGVLPTSSSVGVRYQSTWWKGGDSETENHCGTYVYDNPITRETAPDHWCDAAWCELVDGSKKIKLDAFENPPEIFIRALPSIVRVQNTALLFRVGVGQGTLVVSGLNHLSEVAQTPLNRWTLARMLEAVQQKSTVRWDVSQLVQETHVPEGTVLGFRRVLTAGEQSTWKSYREDNACLFVSRQNKEGNEVAWETAVVPEEIWKSAMENVTFVFAGALGFSGQPKTEGFQLRIDGKDVLKFDIPQNENDTCWASADGRVKLRFEVVRTEPQDRFGRFHLTLSRGLISEGKPLTVEVRSLGHGSSRWFGLNPYWDLR